MKNYIGIAVCTVFMTAAMSMTAFAGNWQQNSEGWWYQNDNGSYPSGSWEWIDGNNDGTMECYCFDGHGYMIAGTTTADGYTVNGDGAWTVNGVVQTKEADGQGGDTGNGFDSQALVNELNQFDTKEYLQLGMGFRVDTSKPALQNGVSNIRNADANGDISNDWVWSLASDARYAGARAIYFIKAYCFNSEGYMYVNTTTPDGFTVNGKGELVVNGTVVMHTNECEFYDKISKSPNISYSAGTIMPIGMLSYEHTEYTCMDTNKAPSTIVKDVGYTNCTDDSNFIWNSPDAYFH